jgi:hypothetical protein
VDNIHREDDEHTHARPLGNFCDSFHVLSCLVWLFLFEIFIYIFFYKKVKCFVNYTALANYYVKKYINNYSTPLSSSFSNGGSGSISNS